MNDSSAELIRLAVIKAFLDPRLAMHNISLREAMAIAEKLDSILTKRGYALCKIVSDNAKRD